MTKAKNMNKATLIAAALIITGSTAIFGTYAASEEADPINEIRCPLVHQELTDEQKVALEEAKELFQAGDAEGAKEILEAAGVKPPRQHRRQEMHQEFIDSLTDEQKAVLEQAKELGESGDHEAARALLDEAGIVPPRMEHRQEIMEKFLENLTDEQKEAFEQAKELRDAGDQEGAKEILEAAGIKPPKRPLRGPGFGPAQ